MSGIRSNWPSGDVPSTKGSSEEVVENVIQLSFSGWEPPPVSKTALDLEKVQAIYDRIGWSFAVDELNQQKRQYGTYGEKAPISMCKALALPYLTFIPSLAELARRLEEYDAYRVTCGFRGRPPTRAKLWHFQYAPLPGEKKRKREGKVDKERKKWFYEKILYQLLVRMVIIGNRLGFDLPFRYIEDAPELFEVDDELSKTALKLPEYPNLEFHLVHEKNARFPVEVYMFELGQFVDSYVIWPPPWWEEEKAKRHYHDEGSESRSLRQYTACSAIILSSDKVLLGKRKTGYKPGYYALPGGRWRSGETLKECLVREIKEEIGLQVIELRPVSLSFNRYDEDSYQECWSVGAVVTAFQGQVTLREPERCEGWDWHDLDALPQPLFRPSRIIIDDYRLDRFPHITWEQIEDWIEKTKQDNAVPTPITQLRLPL